MNFAQPRMLWWSPVLLAALGVFLVWAWRRKQQSLTLFVQARLLDTLTAGVSKTRQKVRLVLLFAGVACIAFALARPQWGMAWEETKQRGLDIVVAIDTSRSMLASDIAPNRLARAKLAALDLMREAKTDRLGVIAFAGTAFLQCPLTLDEEAYRQSVSALDAGIIQQGGSALANAIETALTAFAKDEDNYKILLLFTDGEDHEEGAVEAAKKAAEAGLRIFTVGVGTAEGELLRVPNDQGGMEFLKDAEGNAVKSRLNETLLREIATVAQGFYLPLRGANTIETLYERGLAPLPKSETSSKFIRRHHERFQWPLALGLVLLAGELFVSDRRKRSVSGIKFEVSGSREGATTAIAWLVFLGTATVAMASPAKALRQFEAGNYREARAEYERLLEETPGDSRLRYNAGAAAYGARDYASAMEHFTAALRAEDVTLQQRAYYNLGNSLFRLGEPLDDAQQKIASWEKAAQSYEAALKLKADDADAKHNLELVRKKLEELKQQQQQQQQRPEQQNKDDQQKQQDQQKSDQRQQPQPQQNQKDHGGKKDPQAKQEPPPAGQQDQKDKEGAKRDQQKQEQQAANQKDDPGQKGEREHPQPGKQDRENGQERSAETAHSIPAGQMTIEQALQLLESQKGEVRALIFRPPEKGRQPPRTFKDW